MARENIRQMRMTETLLTKLIGIPDLIIHHVEYDHSRAIIQFIIEHDGFEEKPTLEGIEPYCISLDELMALRDYKADESLNDTV